MPRFENKYWKHNYAYESTKKRIQYIFTNKNAWCVIAMCDLMNPNSWKLLERLKFRREGHLKRMYISLKMRMEILFGKIHMRMKF